ncbi:hypothetical protein GCHA_2940 [Paraglaciecola chathamensis S18K6]|uniref:Lipoprotein n=1 Tax=Paraglaciecola chathamensis S18K6 TaxID=1127672 RepID=A0AAV3V1M6_9ALTE|nr:hypothetical protein GCHA_2940 [Paraglaciecola chathamensis S18K6]
MLCAFVLLTCEGCLPGDASVLNGASLSGNAASNGVGG